jgi:hypothetical protein
MGEAQQLLAETCVIVDATVGKRQGYWETANWGNFQPASSIVKRFAETRATFWR